MSRGVCSQSYPQAVWIAEKPLSKPWVSSYFQDSSQVAQFRILKVALDTPLDFLFDYGWLVEDGAPEPQVGQFAVVPFGRRETTGLIVDIADSSDLAPEKLKNALAVRTQLAPLTPQWIALCRLRGRLLPASAGRSGGAGRAQEPARGKPGVAEPGAQEDRAGQAGARCDAGRHAAAQPGAAAGGGRDGRRARLRADAAVRRDGQRQDRGLPAGVRRKSSRASRRRRC